MANMSEKVEVQGYTDSVVVTRLLDLRDVPLSVLPSYSSDELAPMRSRLLRRWDRPGTSVSGYNGAGGLSGDARVDLS